uniref:interferon alpha/beta receptor 2-like isoform X2 n=1 Tax=Monopterus albus TaxID=43700 RepID=UPI0009B33262|nr:interferon alpha/beta receptor 2-like isoform X2 [Monopterus albus]
MFCILTQKTRALSSCTGHLTTSRNTVHGGMMGLWMLLLLHLHLGNAPWIEVVCASLPAPASVSISSFNMEHILSFLPGPGTPSNTHFMVQTIRPRKNSWRLVAGCSELMAGQTCNLTKVFKDPYDKYQARIQAFTPTQTSNWTVSQWFQPLTDTVLEPPDVSVSGCGNCLIMQLKVPTTRGLKDLYRGVTFHVQRTRDGAQFSLTLPFKEKNVITYLQPGVEYCVTVSVTGLFTSKPVFSKPYCAFTSPPPHRVNVVFILLGVFCMLGFLLIGLVAYGGQLNFKLLKRHLPRSLVIEPTLCSVCLRLFSQNF